MTPERWKVIEALFDECSAAAPAERRALLARHGQEDPELAREVEELLAEAERTDRLGSLIEAPAQAALESLGALGPGDRVGPYRLESLLGEGGMGKVFSARRDDQEFRQRVAVKLLPPGAAARGLEARFRAERQILAGLMHPHIARLLDGGTTEDGQPYLVMEHVDGEPLTDYCDRHRLPIAERLRLFLRVASAVEHAHRHLVVHRDIKPANILVHPETGPKLLDFGIAKILQPGPGRPDGEVDLTEPQDRLLTPDYASPEQILGEPVTTLSDVYSLGVLLFELLTGDRPRRLRELTPAGRAREMTGTSTPRPSTRISAARDDRADDTAHPARLRGLEPAQLRRRLEGDLDTIVLRALDAEPGRRYGSVAELSADVERFLRGEPVLARPDSWRYRASKWIRRHPWGAAAVTAIVALSVSLATALVVYATRVAAERDRALAAEARAETVSDFLIALFEVADPAESRGETVTARELLDRGSDMIEAQLADEPEVQAALLSTLADVHLNLGLVRRAEELHRSALERRLERVGDSHLETAQSRDRLGDTLRQMSEMDGAEAQLRRALATREALLPVDDPAIADSLNNLGLLLLERGRYEAAEPLLRRGFEIRLARLGTTHRDTDVSRMNLGELLTRVRRLDEASMYMEEALRNRRERLGENHPKVAASLHALGTLRHEQGNYEAAESLLKRALAIRREVLPPRHPHLATTVNNLASLLHDQWRLDEAESFYREALDMLRIESNALGYAVTLNNLGSLLEDQGRYEEAEPMYRKSVELRLEVQGEDSRSYRRMLSKLGRLEVRLGALDRAEEHLAEAQAWMEENLSPDDPDLIRGVERLALLHHARGDVERAAVLFREALELAETGFGSKHPARVELRADLAASLAASADPARCRPAVEAARAAAEGISADEIVRGRVELAAGLCARADGRPAEAERASRAAVALLEPKLGPRNHWVRAAQAL